MLKETLKNSIVLGNIFFIFLRYFSNFLRLSPRFVHSYLAISTLFDWQERRIKHSSSLSREVESLAHSNIGFKGSGYWQNPIKLNSQVNHMETTNPKSSSLLGLGTNNWFLFRTAGQGSHCSPMWEIVMTRFFIINRIHKFFTINPFLLSIPVNLKKVLSKSLSRIPETAMGTASEESHQTTTKRLPNHPFCNAHLFPQSVWAWGLPLPPRLGEQLNRRVYPNTSSKKYVSVELPIHLAITIYPLTLIIHHCVE